MREVIMLICLSGAYVLLLVIVLGVLGRNR